MKARIAAAAAADRLPTFSSKLDTTAFVADKFSVDAYFKSILPNATEESVREQLKQLAATREQASAALQQNVHSNHSEFIRTAQDIAQMEADTATLQQLFADFKSVGQDMMEAVPGEMSSPAKDDAASDKLEYMPSLKPMLDNAALERRVAAINAVKNAVEGAQLYLETTERYLLREDDMVELNPETYQPVQVVHVYTFNDGLLIAVPRKGKVPNKRRSTAAAAAAPPKALVAEQFLHFHDLAVINMKDAEGIRNAVKLMKSPDSYLYKAASKDDKAQWLSVLKAATDDFLKSASMKRSAAAFTPAKAIKEEAKGHKRGASIGKAIFGMLPLANRQEKETAAVTPTDNLESSSEVSEASAAASLAKLGLAPVELSAEQWRLIDEQMDELDVMLAHRLFNEAVEMIISLRTFLSQFPALAQNLREVRQSLETRVTLLANRLAADLNSASLLSQTHLRSHIRLLLALGLHEHAREIYLQSRTTTLKDRIRKVKFEGDIQNYIERLSFLVFSFLSDSGEYYRMAFKETQLSSGFVLWATEQLDEYAAIFRRYVFHHHSFRIVVDCLRVAAEHCIEMRNGGYDFLFLIEKEFHQDICGALESYQKRSEALIGKIVGNDRWATVKERRRTLSDGTNVRIAITTSLVDFEGIVREFMDDIEDIYSINLYVPIVSYIASVFEKYLRNLMDVSNVKMLRDLQFFSIVMDVVYVVTFMLPEIEATLKARLDRELPEIDKLQHRMDAIEGLLVESYAKRRAEELTGQFLAAAEKGYGSSKKRRSRGDDLPQSVSTAMLKVVDSMRGLSVDLNFAATRNVLMTTLIQQLASNLAEVQFERWRTPLTTWAAHQLIIDLSVLSYVLAPPTPFASPLASKSLSTAVEHVAMAYTQPQPSHRRRRRGDGDDDEEVEPEESEPSDEPPFLENEQWFAERAKEGLAAVLDGSKHDEFWLNDAPAAT